MNARHLFLLFPMGILFAGCGSGSVLVTKGQLSRKISSLDRKYVTRRQLKKALRKITRDLYHPQGFSTLHPPNAILMRRRILYLLKSNHQLKCAHLVSVYQYQVAIIALSFHLRTNSVQLFKIKRHLHTRTPLLNKPKTPLAKGTKVTLRLSKKDLRSLLRMVNFLHAHYRRQLRIVRCPRRFRIPKLPSNLLQLFRKKPKEY